MKASTLFSAWSIIVMIIGAIWLGTILDSIQAVFAIFLLLWANNLGLLSIEYGKRGN